MKDRESAVGGLQPAPTTAPDRDQLQACTASFSFHQHRPTKATFLLRSPRVNAAMLGMSIVNSLPLPSLFSNGFIGGRQSIRSYVEHGWWSLYGSTPKSEKLLVAINDHKKARARLLYSYTTIKYRLIALQSQYVESKKKTLLKRYHVLLNIVKEILTLDSDGILAIELPGQLKNEPEREFIQRITVYLLENATKATTADFIPAKVYRRSPTVTEAYLTNLYTATYRLVRRYNRLKGLLHQLRKDFEATRIYPFFPRYPLLKRLIKHSVANPVFYEISHEIDERP